MRYTFLILFTFFTLGSGARLFQYLSGDATLEPKDYDWLEGTLEEVSLLNSQHYTYQDQRDMGIGLKLKGYDTGFLIGGRNDMSGAFESAWPHLNLETRAERIGKPVALQIRRDKIRRLKKGERLLVRPMVAGLKMDGETLFTLEDLNRNTDGSFWTVVILLSAMTFGGLIGALNQLALIIEKRKSKGDVAKTEE